MDTEFRKAVLPREMGSLRAFDRKVFPSDYFQPSDWHEFEPWWLVLDGRRKIGCCAFQKHVDFNGEPRQGSLYISTTGILPAFRRLGFGQLMKAWQIAYARRSGFNRIVTNSRKSNKPMIALNKKFGFHVLRTIPRYYCDPDEASVVMEMVMELSLSPA